MPLRGALSARNTFLPTLMYRRITITSNQWLNLLASPVILIPAITSKIIVVEGLQYFVKLVGTAYNNAAVTDLRGTYSGSASKWLEVAVALLTGFTDVTTQSILLTNNQRTAGITSTAALGGSVGNLLLTTSGGEFTTGTGDFIIWLSYRIYDATNLAWF